MHFTRRPSSVKFLLKVLSLLMIISILHYILVIKYNYKTDIKLNTNKYAHSDKCEVKNSKCETIHIGFEYIGYNPSLNLYTMLKSLLFHRCNPLYFHILVDDMSEKILKILFETWSLPQVSITFYNVKNYEWCKAKNQYCSKISKLAFPTLISSHITNKIIVIDTDLFFTSDVYELWNIFPAFNAEQVIGMVEIGDLYYLNNIETLNLPSQKSVILYNLKKLKETGWNHLLFKAIDKILSNLEDFKETDGNVINFIVKENSSMIYYLSCQWNVHTNNLKSKYSCLNKKVQAIKWDTSKMFNAKETDDYYGAFLKYDGYLLREDFLACGGISQSTALKIPFDECLTFNEAEIQQWRTLLYFRNFEYNSIKDDVTLVSQLSCDRLETLEDLSKQWEGPMSLTFYVSDAELLHCLDFIENSELLQKRLNIAYHAVFKEGTNYPINELRNVALRNVVTPYVFLTDIDFLPAVHSYVRIKEHIGRMKNMEKKALIVPAFETTQEIPTTKPELLQMLKYKTVQPFYQRIYKPAYSRTNYPRWIMAQEPYKVQWRLEYEPYIVVQSNVTEYDRRFIGYGWNKVSHIMELYKQGYKFIVLPDVFIVHRRHQTSHDKIKLFRVRSHFRCLQKLKRRFVRELKQKYQIKFI